MTMHAPILTPARELIRDVLAGTAKPYGSDGYYETGDWAWAAQCAEDDNDTSEIEYMMAQEERWQDFREWQGNARSEREAERRSNFDFGNWLAGER